MVGAPFPGNQFIILCGLSFAGKSTLARAIVSRFGFTEVDVDETKFQLYGSGIVDEELIPEDWIRIYAETDRLIENHLRSGRTVVDASRNFSIEERINARNISARVGVPFTTIYVDTPESVARRRLIANRARPFRRDISDRDFEDVIRAMQPPTVAETPLVFQHTAKVEKWISDNAVVLAPQLRPK